MVNLELVSSQHQGRVPVTVIEAKGRLDASNHLHFQAEVQQAIDQGMHYLVLDLSQLTYISSAGLRAIHTLAKSFSSRSEQPARAAKGTGSFKSAYFKLLNPAQNIKEVLELMGFNMILEIHSDLNRAIASF